MKIFLLLYCSFETHLGKMDLVQHKFSSADVRKGFYHIFPNHLWIWKLTRKQEHKKNLKSKQVMTCMQKLWMNLRLATWFACKTLIRWNGLPRERLWTFVMKISADPTTFFLTTNSIKEIDVSCEKLRLLLTMQGLLHLFHHVISLLPSWILLTSFHVAALGCRINNQDFFSSIPH